MAVPQLSKTEVAVLQDDVVKQMSAQVLQKGLDLYRSGAVSDIVVENQTVTAYVSDTSRYYVVLDREWFAQGSACSCPDRLLCDHIAAVFFALQAEHGFPADVLNLKETFRRKDSIPGGAVPIDGPKRRVSLPLEDHALSHWVAYLDQEFSRKSSDSLPTEYDWYNTAQKLEEQIGTLILQASTWPVGQLLVYGTLVHLVALRQVLRKFKQVVDQSGKGWAPWNRAYERIAEQLLFHLEADLLPVEIADAQQIPLERVRELVVFLRDMIATEVLPTTFATAAIQRVWLKILRVRTEASAEFLDWLGVWDNLRLEPSHQEDGNFPRVLSFLCVLAGDDLEAQQIILQTPKIDWGNVSDLTLILLKMQHWDRTTAWLLWWESQLPAEKRILVQDLSEHWLWLGRESTGAREAALQFYSRHKQSSGRFYQRALAEFGRFQTWAELQLLDEVFPSDMDKQSLRLIEKRGPAYLLPIYHQAVEREVAQKNREAYRVAVRWLKKLRIYYKKLKRLDEWQRFMLSFQVKHARLRALQDELQKAGIAS